MILRVLFLLLLLASALPAQVGLNLSTLPLLAQAQVNSLPQTGLIAWWKADYFDNLGLTNNQPIGNSTNGTLWVDSSSGGRNLIQATVASRPLWVTNIFGRRAGVNFSGGLTLTLPSALTIPVNMTVLAVFKEPTSATDGILLGHSSLNRQIRRQQTTLRMFDGSAPEAVSSSTLAATTNGYMAVWKRTGAPVVFIQATNNTVTVISTNNSSGTANSFDLMGNTVVVGQPFNGIMAELAIYNFEMSNAQVAQVYSNYFKPKWSLVN